MYADLIDWSLWDAFKGDFVLSKKQLKINWSETTPLQSNGCVFGQASRFTPIRKPVLHSWHGAVVSLLPVTVTVTGEENRLRMPCFSIHSAASASVDWQWLRYCLLPLHKQQPEFIPNWNPYSYHTSVSSLGIKARTFKVCKVKLNP